LGEKSTGPNPTDRSKSGTKRSPLVEGQGIPLGITIDGANRHDMKMTKATLQSIVVCRPLLSQPPSSQPPSSSSLATVHIQQQQHICLDKGYDYPEVYELLEEYGYTMHICKRGGEDYNNSNKTKKRREKIPKYRARRWVVERTHSWMNRFRRLLIRWEKKEDNYIALLNFVCAWITYKRGGVFG
jgi:putative transposase